MNFFCSSNLKRQQKTEHKFKKEFLSRIEKYFELKMILTYLGRERIIHLKEFQDYNYQPLCYISSLHILQVPYDQCSLYQKNVIDHQIHEML